MTHMYICMSMCDLAAWCTYLYIYSPIDEYSVCALFYLFSFFPFPMDNISLVNIDQIKPLLVR
jgi:hypothetical protein